jgi:myo-inositol-1(or 4)-monophosphatase
MPNYMEICERAARQAGALLLDKWGRVSVREKGRYDLVTEADVAAQQVVRRTILDAFPDHRVVGEEDVSCGPEGAGTAGSPYRWIVDPLDGTTNYVHKVPHFAVSLALEKEGQLLVGAVFNPAGGECYTAELGKGARLNGQPIFTSDVEHLSRAICAVGFPYTTRRDSPDLLVFLEALEHCQSFRRTGSASLNMCYVACGRYDAAWSFSTKPWDVAAATLLIREAGGVVTEPHGGDFVLDDARFIAAANPSLHAETRDLILKAGV